MFHSPAVAVCTGSTGAPPSRLRGMGDPVGTSEMAKVARTRRSQGRTGRRSLESVVEQLTDELRPDLVGQQRDTQVRHTVTVLRNHALPAAARAKRASRRTATPLSGPADVSWGRGITGRTTPAFAAALAAAAKAASQSPKTPAPKAVPTQPPKPTAAKSAPKPAKTKTASKTAAKPAPKSSARRAGAKAPAPPASVRSPDRRAARG